MRGMREGAGCARVRDARGCGMREGSTVPYCGVRARWASVLGLLNGEEEEEEGVPSVGAHEQLADLAVEHAAGRRDSPKVWSFASRRRALGLLNRKRGPGHHAHGEHGHDGIPRSLPSM